MTGHWLRVQLAGVFAISVFSSCVLSPEDEHVNPVIVLGIDSATWDVIDPMMDRGELPNFRRLVERGARADLITLPPLTSPVAWTTYATGTFPRLHHILDFTYPYTAGERFPVESTARKEPALWNVASEYGRTVGVVGYYVTHPAEIVNGFMISDTLLQLAAGTSHPEELAGDLDLADTAEERKRAYARFIPWDYDPRAADDPTAPHHELSMKIRGRIDDAAVRAENARRASLNMLPRQVDLFISYFRIIDYASHTAWFYYDDSDFDVAPDSSERELMGDLIPESYRFIDDHLGIVLREKGDLVNIIVVSDHGAGSATGPYAIRDEALAEKLTGNHRYDGMLLAAGPDIRQGVFQGITMMDVTPLILVLLGIPISEELPGRVPESMLSAEFLERHPSRPVASYRKEWRFVESVPLGAQKDQEALDQLRALGYVSAETPAGRSGMDRALDFWEASPELRAGALQGEFLYYLMRQELEKAEALLNQVRQRDPKLAAALPAIINDGVERIEESFAFTVFPENARDFLSALASPETSGLPRPPD